MITILNSQQLRKGKRGITTFQFFVGWVYVKTRDLRGFILSHAGWTAVFSSSEAQTLCRARAHSRAIIAPSSRRKEGSYRINTKRKSFLLAAKAIRKSPIFSVEKNQPTTVSFFADFFTFFGLAVHCSNSFIQHDYLTNVAT